LATGILIYTASFNNHPNEIPYQYENPTKESITNGPTPVIWETRNPAQESIG
jgi:hypothetical protein